MRLSSSRGYFYGIISSATFGMIPLFALPVIAGGTNNISILVYRFLFSGLLMGTVLALQRKRFRLPRNLWLTVLWLSAAYALTSFLLIHAYLYISSGMATTIHFLYPVVVTLIMTLVFKEKRSAWVFVGVGLAILGVALLCQGDGKIQFSPQGFAFALGSVFTYALFIIGVNRSKAQEMDGVVLTFYVLMGGALLFLASAYAFWGTLEIPKHPTDWIYLLMLALIPTLISDLTLVLAIQHIGSTITSVLGSMEPLTAVTIGILVFAEPFNTVTAIGMASILLAVILVITLGKAKPNSVLQKKS